MSSLSRILSSTYAVASSMIMNASRNGLRFPALPSASINASYQPTGIPNPWSFDIVRENFKTFRPNEYKRVRKLGYYAKMKTRRGRRQIMRRMLKGNFVLTHF